MLFDEFLRRSRPKLPLPIPTLYCFDPGETTGYALFINGELKLHQQIPTHTVQTSVAMLDNILRHATPKDKVIIEDYKVYAWKAEHHSWQSLHTPRLIGCFETLCAQRNIVPIFQMAQQPKGFVTDKKLHEWGYYKPGMKHARDAIRHGCFYLLHNYLADQYKPS